MVATQQDKMLTDGDAAFLRVNNRKPAHALLPGEVFSAENIRFEEGKARPRFGISVQGWGLPGAMMGVWIPWVNTEGLMELLENPQWEDGVRVRVKPCVGVSALPSGLAEDTDYYAAAWQGNPGTLWGLYPTAADAIAETNLVQTGAGADDGRYLVRALDGPKTCAYARFNDPNGVDNGVLLTDDWRDGNGEDGGRGRAWRICPGNAPTEIPMNGHDIWGTCRLKQAYHTMLMARIGNERHYFSAAAVDAGANTIQLNATPDWHNGDLVFYQPEANSEIVPGPNPHAKYYVRTDGNDKVTLHGTRADAIAGTNAIDLGTAIGKFYLERSEDDPGPFGNGASTLIMQPTDTESAFEVGFDRAPQTVQVTDSDAAFNVIVAPSHHLQIGDQVTAPLSTDSGLAGFVYPLSDHKFKLFSTQALAMAAGASALTGASGEVDVTADDQTGAVTKVSAAALALPPLREMIYYKGRIIGIVQSTKDTIVVSDPFDFLHYSLFVGTVKANLGESGFANWLLELGDDALLIGKDLCVLAIAGLSGPDTGWVMDDVTREYGGVSPLGAVNVGADAWFMSRKGVASIIRTVAGQKLGVARTKSADIPQQLVDIDWANIHLACAETWNGRFFIAVALKGQSADAVRNNRVLVFNLLNQLLTVQQLIVADQVIGGVADADAPTDSWEGHWTGDLLEPYAFAKLKVAGEERLTFATPDGYVAWFTDGFEDYSGAVPTEATLRGYFGGARVLALKGEVNWDTYNPKLSVRVKTAGYNESSALVEELQFDRSKYMIDGQADYDPNTSTEETFDVPHREDYSPSPEELLVARLDVHQNQTENLRLRTRDRAPQLVIGNTQGSVRIVSAQLNAVPVGLRATRQS
jgi:hypothetical protein